MAEKVKVARLTDAQIGIAAEVLARFLNDQPVASIFGDDPEERMRKFREGYAPLLQYCCAHGHPHVATIGSKLVGVALWMPPHGSRATPEEEREYGLDLIPATFGKPVESLRPLGNLLRDLHVREMKGPHWFLGAVMIDPTQQGKGIASALMRSILARADEGHLPCYTDTIRPEMVSFFRRHGFNDRVAGTEPETNIQYWTLRRDPAPSPER
jgi:GNAT superfamily N-acetyltransferase